MKEAPPELARRSTRCGRASRSRASRRCRSRASRDHHLSWAQWFADSDVPGVIRARWFEQRHMLHHTRRWNRDHADELHSSWLNGTGMLVWDVVFGVWVGWNERDRGLLRTMVGVQRAACRAADRTASGRRSRRAARDLAGRRLALARRRRDALGARRTGSTSRSTAIVDLDGDRLAVALPGARARGRRARRRASSSRRRAARRRSRRGRRRASRRRAARVARCPTGSSQAPPPRRADGGLPPPRDGHATARRRTSRSGSRCRRGCTTSSRSSGPRRSRAASRSASARSPAPTARRSTNVTLDEARAHAASLGARLPTEDEWQAAAAAGLLERLEPLVWNWTESEHRDGRTRFAILKGGAAYEATGSDWYADGGERGPEYSFKLLLVGGACSVRRRSASGSRSTCRERARTARRDHGSSRRRRSSRRRSPRCCSATSAPTWSRSSIRRKPDPARGHGASKDGVGLWFKTLSRNKRLITLDLSRARGPRRVPAARRTVRRRDRELPARHARALGARPRRALRRQPAGRDRARSAASGRPGRTPHGRASARSPRR